MNEKTKAVYDALVAGVSGISDTEALEFINNIYWALESVQYSLDCGDETPITALRIGFEIDENE